MQLMFTTCDEGDGLTPCDSCKVTTARFVAVEISLQFHKYIIHQGLDICTKGSCIHPHQQALAELCHQW